MTYEELAEELHTKVGALYSLTVRPGNPLYALRQRDPIEGTQMRNFTPEQVEEIKAWWKLNQGRQALTEMPDEPAVDMEGMRQYMGWKHSTQRYYWDRYHRPEPDFRLFSDKQSKGQPKAMYFIKTLEELKQWIADGKPEPHRVHYVMADREGFERLVTFRDGVRVGFRENGEVVIFPPMNDEQAASYVEMAKHAERGRGRKLKKRRMAIPTPPEPPVETDAHDKGQVLLIWSKAE